MLPPFIIDQIRRREEALRRQYDEQPRVDVPLPSRGTEPAAPRHDDDEDRGVIVIDL